MLISARRDPDAWLMRAVVLHGERPFSSPSSFGSGAEFRRRLRSGLAGISEDGRLLALPTAGRDADELAICMLWMSPVRYIDIRPSLIITSSSALAADRWVAVPLIGALMGLP
jgi:hypothetical protein